MADYNIYIHNINQGEATSSPTKAWQSMSGGSQTKAWVSSAAEGNESFSGAVTAFKSEVSDTIVGGATIGAMKYAPVVAAAAIVMRTSIRVMEGVMSYFSKETGNYDHFREWENLKANFRALTHPVTTWITWQKTMQETRLYNQKQEQAQVLIGESFVNNTIRRF